MAKVFDDIDDHLQRWIAAQQMFFVGTAPLAADGHVNVSPKGPIDTLRVLDPDRRLPGHDRQRRRDDRPRARERAHRRDVLRVQRAAADPAPARPRLRSWSRPTRGSRSWQSAASSRCRRVPEARRAIVLRGRRPRRRRVRIRRAADDATKGCARTRAHGRRRSSASAAPMRCWTTSERRTRTASTVSRRSSSRPRQPRSSSDPRLRRPQRRAHPRRPQRSSPTAGRTATSTSRGCARVGCAARSSRCSRRRRATSIR